MTRVPLARSPARNARAGRRSHRRASARPEPL